MRTHYLQQRDQTADVVTIVEQRFLHRLTYRLAGCKMDHTYRVRIGRKHAIQIDEVTTVDIGELRTTAHNLLYAVQHVHRRVAQVVYYRHIVSLLHQFNSRMRTYIAGSSGY